MCAASKFMMRISSSMFAYFASCALRRYGCVDERIFVNKCRHLRV